MGLSEKFYLYYSALNSTDRRLKGRQRRVITGGLIPNSSFAVIEAALISPARADYVRAGWLEVTRIVDGVRIEDFQLALQWETKFIRLGPSSLGNFPVQFVFSSHRWIEEYELNIWLPKPDETFDDSGYESGELDAFFAGQEYANPSSTDYQ